MKTIIIFFVFVFLAFTGNFSAQKTEKDSIAKHETSIKEVVINGKKPLIKNKIDGLVYDVQSDPESSSKSLMEIMKKMPYLSVTGEENLSHCC